MNEHQVAIGESTCASKLWAAPTTAGAYTLQKALKRSDQYCFPTIEGGRCQYTHLIVSPLH
jgi:hypothetical protein